MRIKDEQLEAWKKRYEENRQNVTINTSNLHEVLMTLDSMQRN
jgi:hypothetical protein